MEEAWSLWAKKIDSTKLFKELRSLFTGEYTVFIEGTSISDQAIEHYINNSSRVKFIPGVSAIWPKSKQFSCSSTDSFWKGLIEISENHAEPELFDHFFIYKGDVPFLEWWDSFTDPFYISTTVDEKAVNNLAARLGLKQDKIKEKTG